MARFGLKLGARADVSVARCHAANIAALDLCSAQQNPSNSAAFFNGFSGAALALYQGMYAFDASQKMMGRLQVPAAAPMAQTAAASAKADAQAGAKTDDGENFFDHLLDVVNPLQHLPVIGTVYRAMTGDKIGAGEKIAGDALYSGLWGAIGSVADVVFEAATGKDFGNTLLALVSGDDAADAGKAIASAAPKKDFGDRLWAMFTGSQDDAAAPRALAAVTAPAITQPQGLPSAAFPSLPASEMPVTVASAKPLPESLDVAALSMALSGKGVDAQTVNRALYAYRRSMIAPPAPVMASLY